MTELRKTIHLHIGLPKTGTSAIQKAFYENPSVLSGFDVRYLQAGTQIFHDFGHHFIVMLCLGEEGMRIDSTLSRKQLEEAWAAAHEEIMAAPEQNIFISSELFALDATQPDQISQIHRVLSFNGSCNLKAVVTLRDLVSFTNSVYAQRVRDGYDGDIGELLEFIWDSLNWKTLVDRWKAVFGEQNVTALRFEALDRNAMADDFLRKALHLPPDGPMFPPVSQVNRSMPHSAIEFFRDLNRTFLTDQQKLAIRNQLSSALDQHNLGMKRPDFLSPEAKSILRYHCKWPDDCI